MTLAIAEFIEKDMKCFNTVNTARFKVSAKILNYYVTFRLQQTGVQKVLSCILSVRGFACKDILAIAFSFTLDYYCVRKMLCLKKNL